MPYDRTHQKLYKTARWLRTRLFQLAKEPLCEKCKAKGLTVEASVAHHLVPHKGDLTLFFTSPLQSLCAPCHDHITQQQERSGFVCDIGIDGYPTDHKHPFYRTK